MKMRVISAMLALLVLLVAVLFFDTSLPNFFASFIVAVGTYEYLAAKKLVKYKLLTYSSMFFSISMMFINYTVSVPIFMALVVVYITFCFLSLVILHDEVDVGDVCYTITGTMFATIPLHLVFLIYNIATPQVAMFYLLMLFGSAWWSDTGAFFVGTFLGKHKLCPRVSPKKTIEGLVGGVIAGTIGNILVAYAFYHFAAAVAPYGYFTSTVEINYWAVALTSPILSLIGVLGDLVASVIKRQTGIKDFGNIMPGHGGVIDRFDSVIFISPFIFLLYMYFPFISLV